VQIEEEEALEKTPKTPKYVQKHYSEDQIIGDKNKGVLARRKVVEEQVILCLLSKVEPRQ